MTSEQMAEIEARAEAEVRRLRAAVDAALDTLDGAGCVFWACEGPDSEPVDMKTCRVCWAVHDLRRALADPGPHTRGLT